MSRATSTTRRWCPTPEQLMILEQMYKSGSVRTPNATQIQQITTHLSYYGRVEGKNVFYWFQNHKARERQKLRRKLSMQLHQKTQPQYFQQEEKMNKNLHQVFYCIDEMNNNFNYKSLVPCSTPQQLLLSCCSTASSLPRGGSNEDEALTTKVTTWEKKAMTAKIYDREVWDMVKFNEGDKNRLKTLELFPIKDHTNLKEDYCNKTTSTKILDDDCDNNIVMSLSLSLYV